MASKEGSTGNITLSKGIDKDGLQQGSILFILAAIIFMICVFCMCAILKLLKTKTDNPLIISHIVSEKQERTDKELRMQNAKPSGNAQVSTSRAALEDNAGSGKLSHGRVWTASWSSKLKLSTPCKVYEESKKSGRIRSPRLTIPSLDDVSGRISPTSPRSGRIYAESSTFNAYLGAEHVKAPSNVRAWYVSQLKQSMEDHDSSRKPIPYKVWNFSSFESSLTDTKEYETMIGKDNSAVNNITQCPKAKPGKPLMSNIHKPLVIEYPSKSYDEVPAAVSSPTIQQYDQWVSSEDDIKTIESYTSEEESLSSKLLINWNSKPKSSGLVELTTTSFDLTSPETCIDMVHNDAADHCKSLRSLHNDQCKVKRFYQKPTRESITILKSEGLLLNSIVGVGASALHLKFHQNLKDIEQKC